MIVSQANIDSKRPKAYICGMGRWRRHPTMGTAGPADLGSIHTHAVAQRQDRTTRHSTPQDKKLKLKR